MRRRAPRFPECSAVSRRRDRWWRRRAVPWPRPRSASETRRGCVLHCFRRHDRTQPPPTDPRRGSAPERTRSALRISLGTSLARQHKSYAVLIYAMPARFLLECRTQRPIMREQGEIKPVAVHQLAPGAIGRHQRAVVGPERRTEEVAAAIEENTLARIELKNQVVGPLV